MFYYKNSVKMMFHKNCVFKSEKILQRNLFIAFGGTPHTIPEF